ncbi:MAG TPA: hypothetical protein PK413_04560 [Thermoanaerobaculia bacterium]|nr:hypothetical protein [Thermoanaerobaculia bacterium]
MAFSEEQSGWLAGAHELMLEISGNGTAFILLGPSWLVSGLQLGRDYPDVESPGCLDLLALRKWDALEGLLQAIETLEGELDPPSPIPVIGPMRAGQGPFSFRFGWGRVRVFSSLPGLGDYEKLYVDTVFVDWDGVSIPMLGTPKRSLERP